MKILLDECLPVDFRHCFPSHEAHTVEWAGFKGLKNGALLQAAEAAGYRVLLTVDRGFAIRPGPLGISVIVIHPRTNQLGDLEAFVPAIEGHLCVIRPSETVNVTDSL